MLRKHINSIPISNFQSGEFPFYSWECITIINKYREVNLVIKNEDEMMKLIAFLIYTLKTNDGKRNSAIQQLKNKNWEEVQNYYRSVLLKYKIIKLRMKISYHAKM